MSKAISFTGRVQGVGFRYATAHEARSLRLGGWVKNESDGSVAGAATGPEDVLAKFVTFLKRGPSSARVDDLNVQSLTDDAAQRLPEQFEIRK
ncbi:hypothetical protein OC861_006430 [Tilletia horrida]|nr:hypothetical protein OC861_006430 [Tilletia horrida]